MVGGKSRRRVILEDDMSEPGDLPNRPFFGGEDGPGRRPQTEPSHRPGQLQAVSPSLVRAEHTVGALQARR